MGKPRIEESIPCQKDQMGALHLLEGFVRLERPLTRETSLTESAYVVSGK